VLNRFRIAFSFLTILPTGSNLKCSPRALSGSAVFFPVVGWFVGGIVAGIGWLTVYAGGTPMLGAVAAVAAGVIITRGLHLDGVADVLDGLGGSFETSRRLEIMKDSFIGPFGVIGLVLLLIGKIAVLAMLLENSLPVFLPLITVSAAARWAMVAQAYRSKYPRVDGTGHPFVGKITGRNLLFASVLMLPFLFFGWFGLVMVLAAQLPPLWLRQKAHQAFGGVTGDVLGASCEFSELAGWFAGALYLGILS
jgi:adenosylcobinamide-GDP ribazoletransferase